MDLFVCFSRVLALLVLALSFSCFPIHAKKRVINYEPVHNVRQTSAAPSFLAVYGGEKKMEDILDNPHFRYRKTDLGDDPNVWGDALSAYDNMLRFRENKQQDPNGDAIGIYKPGLFVPYVEMTDSFAAKRELPENKEKSVEDRGETNTLGRSFALDFEKSPRQADAANADLVPMKCPTFPVWAQISQNTTNSTSSETQTPSSVQQISSTDTLFVWDRLMAKKELDDEVYDKCGVSEGKLCFGWEESCIKSKRCRLFVSMKNDSNPPDKVLVTLMLTDKRIGKHPFVGLGFSKDSHPGEDLFIYCIDTKGKVAEEKPETGDRTVALYISYLDNKQHSHMQLSKKAYKSSVCPMYGYTTQHILACTFELAPTVVLDNGEAFNILREAYYQMLVFGEYKAGVLVSDKLYGAIQHHEVIINSGSSVNLATALANPEIIAPKSRILINVHVITSVIAYLFLIPASMVCAKYGREVYGYKRTAGCCRVPEWLILHFRLNVVSIPLTFISLVCIVVELEFQWRSFRFYPMLHSVTGSLSMFFLAVSFGTGFLFDLKNSHNSIDVPDRRVRFMAWFHWLVGNLTYFTGLICVVFATNLKRAIAPCFVGYFGYLHLVLYCVPMIVLSVDTFRLVKQIDGRYMFQRAILGPMIPWTKGEIAKVHHSTHASGHDFHEAPIWKMRRRVIFYTFIVGCLCAFAISVLMFLPLVLCRETDEDLPT